MTVQDLHKDIIQRDSENNGNIKDLGIGCLIGIDISIYMYRILTHNICVKQYHSGPDVPVTFALSLLQKRHRWLVAKGCVPVYVFDGARHPMKHATDEKRKAARTKIERRLSELQDEDEEALTKLQTRAVYPREDILALIVQWLREENILHFSAPFEAEWQLVALERQGLIDAIVSEDGDCLILGAKTVITRLDFFTGSCYIYHGDEIWQRESAGGGEWIDHLPEMAAFLGNDYNRRLFGFSPRKVRSEVLPSFISAENKDGYLDDIEQNSKWPKSHDPYFQSPATGFADQFKKVSNLFRYPPVFILTLADNYENIDLHDPQSFEVSLKPLNPFEDCSNMCSAMQRRWGETIGFHNRPSKLLHGDTNADYKAGFCLQIWPRTGEPLPGYAAMAKREIKSQTEIDTVVDNLLSNFRVSNESGEEYSLEGLFEVASVYIGITKVEIEDEKLMFLTERGAAVPVIKWADNSCIKRRDAVDILKFQTTTLFVNQWQANIAKVELALHQRFDHLELGKQKLWRIPGMGGIRKRQTKKDEIYYKVFVDYSFIVPALIDAGEINVLPNRRHL